MHYTAKNLKISLNNNEFLTQDVQLGLQAQLEPVYLTEQRHSFYYAPQNGIGGTLSLNYLLTGNDYLKTLLTDETTPISGYIGGMYFRSGYLRSYSFNAQPNSPIAVKSDIVFFDDLDGFFAPSYERARNIQPLIMSDAQVFDLADGRADSISGITSFNFQFNSNIEPVYRTDETTPYRIAFKEKEIVATLQLDGITGVIPVSGSELAVKLHLNYPTKGTLEIFQVSGKVSQREISTANKEFVKNSVTVRQNYLKKGPVVTSFLNPTYVPGDTVTFFGTDLDNIILIGIGAYSASFTSLGTGSGSFIIPEGATSGDALTISTFEGTTTASGNFFISNRPLGISGITPLTGYELGIVKISGSNFYNISKIYFGTGAAYVPSPSFTVTNPNTIQATIPLDARWDYVSVLSDTRGLSGRSPYKFAPIPQITGIIPNSGVSGDFVTISGSCFTSVLSGTFNNLLSPSLTVVNNSGIRAQVPSGNIFGYVKLYGVSGVITTSPNKFYPIVQVTGISPYTGVTGEPFTILGTNFYNELMYNTDAGSSHFLASVGGATGQYYRVNPGKLTGIIPSAASSGYVYIFDSNQTPYSSTVFFTLKYGQPFISGIFPVSGKVNDVIQFQGTNLFEASGVNVSGVVSNTLVTGTGVITSILGDLVSFYAPNVSEGHYNLTLTTSHGKATGISGTSQGFYLMKDPVVSGFLPISGGVGNIILLSGLNLYPQTQVYFNNTGVRANNSGGVNITYTQLSFLVPIGASGLNTVFVYNGVSNATGSGVFTLIRAPFISGFLPISGEWGEKITVSGSYLGQTTGVYVGSGNIGFTNTTNSQFTFNIPTGLVSDYIYAYSPGGFGISATKFASLPPRILISGLNPTGIRPSRRLLIVGNYLSGTEQIWFSGQTQAVTGFIKVGQTGIYVDVPENTVSGFVTLVNSRGLSLSSQILNIVPDPRILLVSPTYGSFGQLISVNGSDMTGMKFFFTSANSGLWSGLIDTNVQVVTSSTGATFTVPKNISIGTLVMSGDNEIFVGWTGIFTPLPTISGFAPTGAITGSVITVTGYNATQINGLLFATGNGNVAYVVGQLTGDHSNITGIGVLSPTTGYSLWSGVINSNFGGLGNVFLISRAFTGINNGDLFRSGDVSQYISQIISPNQFFFNQTSPLLTGFSPVRGNTNTVVSVSGINFRMVTGLYINNVIGTVIQTITGTTLDTVKFKPGISNGSGRITGVSAYGTTISIDSFTFIPNPDISGFTPKKGIISNTVRITGSDFQFVTGVFFGDFQATYTTGYEGNYVITGVVPNVTYALPQNVLISLWNEAGVGQAGYYTVFASGAIQKYRTANADLQPIPASNGQLQFAHNLGAIPDSANVVLVNRTAENGYSIDDEVNLSETTTQSIGGGEPFSISKDATNITLSHQFGTYPLIEVMNKTATSLITGGLNTGNWSLRAVGWRQFDS